MSATPAAEPVPCLWHFRVSHYNEKVRWALDFKHWPHERRAVVPGFHLIGARLRSGQSRLPILQLGRQILFDSTRIIAALEQIRPDPPLYPADAAARARALAIEDDFDEEVAPTLRRLFWSTYLDRPQDCLRMATDGFGAATRLAWRLAWPAMRPLARRNMQIDDAQLERAHRDLASYFDRLESEIGPSGYLVGDRFTIADLTAAAVMTAIIRPPQFSYRLPDPWPSALVALRASVAHRPGFKWVLDIYARHRGPSYEIGRASRGHEVGANA